jgi:CheY-like chemotaxis protein
MPAKRVLVIDDDRAVRAMIRDALADCGYDVSAAADGEEGIALALSLSPCLIVTDIIMPRKTGLDVIAEVRRSRPDIRLLAISGGGRDKSDDPLARAQALGCHAVMRKPLDMDELEKTVERLTADPED